MLVVSGDKGNVVESDGVGNYEIVLMSTNIMLADHHFEQLITTATLRELQQQQLQLPLLLLLLLLIIITIVTRTTTMITKIIITK